MTETVIEPIPFETYNKNTENKNINHLAMQPLQHSLESLPSDDVIAWIMPRIFICSPNDTNDQDRYIRQMKLFNMINAQISVTSQWKLRKLNKTWRRRILDMQQEQMDNFIKANPHLTSIDKYEVMSILHQNSSLMEQEYKIYKQVNSLQFQRYQFNNFDKIQLQRANNDYNDRIMNDENIWLDTFTEEELEKIVQKERFVKYPGYFKKTRKFMDSLKQQNLPLTQVNKQFRTFIDQNIDRFFSYYNSFFHKLGNVKLNQQVQLSLMISSRNEYIVFAKTMNTSLPQKISPSQYAEIYWQYQSVGSDVFEISRLITLLNNVNDNHNVILPIIMEIQEKSQLDKRGKLPPLSDAIKAVLESSKNTYTHTDNYYASILKCIHYNENNKQILYQAIHNKLNPDGMDLILISNFQKTIFSIVNEEDREAIIQSLNGFGGNSRDPKFTLDMIPSLYIMHQFEQYKDQLLFKEFLYCTFDTPNIIKIWNEWVVKNDYVEIQGQYCDKILNLIKNKKLVEMTKNGYLPTSNRHDPFGRGMVFMGHNRQRPKVTKNAEITQWESLNQDRFTIILKNEDYALYSVLNISKSASIDTIVDILTNHLFNPDTSLETKNSFSDSFINTQTTQTTNVQNANAHQHHQQGMLFGMAPAVQVQQPAAEPEVAAEPKTPQTFFRDNLNIRTRVDNVDLSLEVLILKAYQQAEAEVEVICQRIPKDHKGWFNFNKKKTNRMFDHNNNNANQQVDYQAFVSKFVDTE